MVPETLLHAAFRDVIPAAALSRRTKGEYNADIHHGWSTHHRQVNELLDRPQLVERGLIDPVTLRERWLRSAPAGYHLRGSPT